MDSSLISRQIRVFISSTFQDMQAERDYLINKVFPKLRLEAQKRNVSLVPVDLRWGITREEEGQSGKVVYTCLNEIEKSHPFFIGILGNRYGWKPTENDLMVDNDFRQRYGWIANDIRNGMSITEIEMQYGVLRSKETVDAYFFMRKDGDGNGKSGLFSRLVGKEGNGDAEKLAKLKKTIKNQKRYLWAEYTTPEELGSSIERAFLQLLDRLYPEKNLSNLEHERMEQLSFISSRCLSYLRRDAYHKELDDFVLSGQKMLYVSAESGMGKSALLANWIKEHTDKQKTHSIGDNTILYHFVANTSDGGNADRVLGHFIDEIEDIFGVSPIFTDQRKDYKKALETQLNSEKLRDKKILFVIDAIDQLDTNNYSDVLSWLPDEAPNARFIVSAVSGSRPDKKLRQMGCRTIEMTPLTKEQRVEMSKAYLKLHSKELEPQRLERIVNDKKSENTLVLRTLLDEMMAFGIYERLDDRIDYYLQASSVDDFFERVLRRCENDYDSNLVRTATSVIAISRNGIDEATLLSITKAKQIEWSQFFCGFAPHLIVKNGLVGFSHRHMRNAVMQRYLSNPNTKSELHKSLAYTLLQQAGEHTSYTNFEMSEIPYQLHLARDFDALYRFLLNAQVESYLDLANYNDNDWAKYWRALYGVDSKKYSVLSLIPILSDASTWLLTGLSNKVSKYLSNDEAAIISKRIIEIEGTDSPNAGIAELRLVEKMADDGDVDQAIAKLQAMIDGCSNGKDIFGGEIMLDHYQNAMGGMLARKGESGAARIWYQKVISRLEASNLYLPSRCQAYYGVGETYLSENRYQEAIEYLEKALSCYRESYGEENMGAVYSLSLLASANYHLGNPEKALEYYQQELEMSQHLLDPDDKWIRNILTNMAYIYDELGDSKNRDNCLYKVKYGSSTYDAIQRIYDVRDRANQYMGQGDYKYALELFKEFLNITNDNSTTFAYHRALALSNMSECCNKLGDAKMDLEYSRLSTVEADKLTGDEDIDHACPVFYNYGTRLQLHDFYKESITQLEKFIKIKSRPHAKDEPQAIRNAYQYIWSNCRILCEKSRAEANFDEATRWAEKMVDACRASIGTETPEMGNAYAQLAMISEGKLDFKQALAYYDKAIALYAPTANQYPIMLGSICGYAGDLCMKNQKWKEAEKYHQMSVQYHTAASDHRYLSRALNQLSMAIINQGRYRDAYSYACQALKEASELYGNNRDPRLAILYQNIGFLLEKLGDKKQAKEFMDYANYLHSQKQ